MAKDDYYVIAYKFLSYLYACLKTGEPVDVDNLMAVLNIDLTPGYWDYIVRHLLADGYIENVSVFKRLGSLDPGVKINNNVAITPKGIDYLNSNTAIAKAKNFLKEIKEILPWI